MCRHLSEHQHLDSRRDSHTTTTACTCGKHSWHHAIEHRGSHAILCSTLLFGLPSTQESWMPPCREPPSCSRHPLSDDRETHQRGDSDDDDEGLHLPNHRTTPVDFPFVLSYKVADERGHHWLEPQNPCPVPAQPLHSLHRSSTLSSWLHQQSLHSK